MAVPLTWNEEGATVRAFMTGAFYRGEAVGQLQMHLRGRKGYRIETICFDEQGNEVAPMGACPMYETSSEWPTFAIVKPEIDNTRVDMSPYGRSVFADAIDAIRAVDLAFDSMISEVNNGKMRVFLSDVMFDQEEDGKGRKVSTPFGRQDCTVFRKVMSTEDTIQGFAPQLPHRRAGEGTADDVADAGRSLQVRNLALRLQQRGVREDSDRGVERQQRPDEEHQEARACS